MSYESGENNIGFSWSYLYDFLLKIINEQQRYLHSPAEVGLTLVFLSSLLYGGKSLIRNNKFLIIYLSVLMFGLAIITTSKTSKYMIPLLPYIIILTAMVLKEKWTFVNNRYLAIPKNWNSFALLFSLVFFIGFSSFFNYSLALEKFTNIKNQEIINKYVKSDHSKTSILGPMTIIFGEIGNFKEIIGLMSFNERSKTDDNIFGRGLFLTAEAEGIDYVFINDYYINKFQIKDIIKDGLTEGYKFVGKHNDLTIFEKKNILFEKNSVD